MGLRGRCVMTGSALYRASAPVFLRYLGQLQGLLALQHAARVGMSEQVLLDAALSQAMLPFATQVEIACNFSLRASFPLANLPIPTDEEYERTFAGLQHRLERAAPRWNTRGHSRL